jgi:hypothetical protein
MGRWSVVFAALALNACAAVPAAMSPPVPTATVAAPPPAATQYTTAARPDGVVGGPRAAALANEVREALRARGDAAEPDGALAAVAAWFRESRRLHLSRGPVCLELVQVLELDELEQDPLVLQRRSMKIGLATATKQIGRALKLFVLVLAEGASCQ